MEGEVSIPDEGTKRRAVSTPASAIIGTIAYLLMTGVLGYITVTQYFDSAQSVGWLKWMMAALTLFSFGAAIHQASQIPAALRLKREGVTVQGQVIRKWEQYSRRSRTTHIRYGFKPQGYAGSYSPEGENAVYGAQQQVPRSWWKQLEPGSAVTVRYLPEEPEKSRAEREQE